MKCPNNLALKEKIAIHLYHMNVDKKSQHDKHVRDLPSLLVRQRVRVLDQEVQANSPRQSSRNHS